MLVEPACGAALCAAYLHSQLGLGGKENDYVGEGPVVVVVCGGNMASPELFDGWRRQLGMKEEETFG